MKGVGRRGKRSRVERKWSRVKLKGKMGEKRRHSCCNLQGIERETVHWGVEWMIQGIRSKGEER